MITTSDYNYDIVMTVTVIYGQRVRPPKSFQIIAYKRKMFLCRFGEIEIKALPQTITAHCVSKFRRRNGSQAWPTKVEFIRKNVR
jgi:hypothetical protein